MVASASFPSNKLTMSSPSFRLAAIIRGVQPEPSLNSSVSLSRNVGTQSVLEYRDRMISVVRGSCKLPVGYLTLPSGVQFVLWNSVRERGVGLSEEYGGPSSSFCADNLGLACSYSLSESVLHDNTDYKVYSWKMSVVH